MSDLLPPEATGVPRKQASAARQTSYRAIPSTSRSAIASALEQRLDDVQPSRLREVYVPAILLPVGAFAGFVAWTNVAGSMGEALVLAVAVVGLQVLVFLPWMVGVLAKVAAWFELGLGNLGPVIFKAAAVTLGPAAVADVLFVATMSVAAFDYWFIIAGFAFYMVLLGLPLIYLFEMGLAEGATAALAAYLPRVGAMVLAIVLFPDSLPTLGW